MLSFHFHFSFLLRANKSPWSGCTPPVRSDRGCPASIALSKRLASAISRCLISFCTACSCAAGFTGVGGWLATPAISCLTASSCWIWPRSVITSCLRASSCARNAAMSGSSSGAVPSPVSSSNSSCCTGPSHGRNPIVVPSAPDFCIPRTNGAASPTTASPTTPNPITPPLSSENCKKHIFHC